VILCFAVAATGALDRESSLYAQTQPRIIRIAASLYDGTVERNVFDEIIRPDGWIIPSAASREAGITQLDAMRCGMEIPGVLGRLRKYAERCTSVATVDRDHVELVMSERGRAGLTPGWIPEGVPVTFMAQRDERRVRSLNTLAQAISTVRELVRLDRSEGRTAL
jgi:hypothetical protein